MTDADPTPPSPPLDEAALLAFLDQLGVDYRIHRHPPVFTVEESRSFRDAQPGAHVKNMFLKDKKGGLWLVTCLEDRRIKIRDLEKALSAPKLSFGKPDLMTQTIGVTPGAVTPLAVLNDAERVVTLVVDAAVLGADLVNCHPLHNEATIALSASDLVRVVGTTGHTPRMVDFDALEAVARGD